MIAWLSGSFIYGSTTLLFPILINQVFFHVNNSSNSRLEYVFLIGLAFLEMLCYFISPYFINHPKIGDKRFLYLCFVWVFIFSILATFARNINLIVAFVLMTALKAGGVLIQNVFVNIFRFCICSLLDSIKLSSEARPKEYALCSGEGHTY